MYQKIFSLKNIITGAIIIGLIILLSILDTCRNRDFNAQKNLIDSLTLANQELIQTKNKLGQEVSKQAVIIADDQDNLRYLTDSLFKLNKKDEKRIKQINSLVQIKQQVRVDTTEISYVDTTERKRFSDSVEQACDEVITYFKENSVRVPKHVEIDSTQNRHFQFDGTVGLKSFTINKINLPDSQRIALIETGGGLLKRDIHGKLKIYQRPTLEVMVLHTNTYYQIQGMSSVVYKPKIKGRWLERTLIFVAGIGFTLWIQK